MQELTLQEFAYQEQTLGYLESISQELNRESRRYSMPFKEEEEAMTR